MPQRRKNRALICLLLWGLYCTAGKAQAPATAADWDRIARNLVPFFKTHVKTFSRPIHLFHGTKNTDSSDEKYLASQVAKAFDPGYSSDAAGPGLYLAKNTRDSASYGKRIFVLETVPEQFRFLDITLSGFALPYLARYLNPKLLQESADWGCFFWLNPKEWGQGNCAALRRSLMQQLGVSAVAFPYASRVTSHPEEIDNTVHAAFVLSALTGVSQVGALKGDSLAKSELKFARAHSFATIEDWQSARFLGLNHEFSGERNLGFGNSPENLDSLQKDFREVTPPKPIEYYLKTSKQLRLYREYPRAFQLLGTSYDQRKKNWVDFLNKVAIEIPLDETSAKDENRNYSVSIAFGLNLELFEPRYLIPSVRVAGQFPKKFPAGPLPPVCQRTLNAHIETMQSDPLLNENDQKILAQLKKILASTSPYKAIFDEYPSADTQLDQFMAPFRSPSCLVTEAFLNKEFGDEIHAPHANYWDVYLRPSHPQDRRKIFLRLQEEIMQQSLSNAAPEMRANVLYLIQNLFILDPLVDTASTQNLVDEFVSRFLDFQTATYLESIEIRAKYRIFYPNHFDIQPAKDNQRLTVEELHKIVWQIYSIENSIPK